MGVFNQGRHTFTALAVLQDGAEALEVEASRLDAEISALQAKRRLLVVQLERLRTAERTLYPKPEN